MLNSREAILNKLQEPVVFKGCTWSLLSWDLEKWGQEIGDCKLSFRVGHKISSDVPQWESKCAKQDLNLEEFKSLLKNKENWYYFDYKHLRECFQNKPEILKSIDWSFMGFPELGSKDSTIWMGSEGAHTPCHVDTYGCNLVAQLQGQKQWILFPPSLNKQMQVTRVPYEESSIYSDINFYSPPEDLEELHGARVITLTPGDVLFVPNGWWHYVETISPYAISVNTWIPLEQDAEKRVEEALVKLLVSSVCRVTPNFVHLLNPNEDQIMAEPILEYLQDSLSQCSELPLLKKKKLEYEQRKASSKKTEDKEKSNETNSLSLECFPVQKLTWQELNKLLEEKRKRFSKKREENVDAMELFSKELINTMCDGDFLALLTQKLLQLN